MSKQQEIRVCQKHGETVFALRSNGKKNPFWKCLKCETEAVQKRREKLKAMAIAYKGGKYVDMTDVLEHWSFITQIPHRKILEFLQKAILGIRISRNQINVFQSVPQRDS